MKNKLYAGKIFKINSTHNNIRSETMDGVTASLPTVGHDFRIFGEALEHGYDRRGIFTTTVQELVELSNRTYLFRTLNSTYVFRVDKEIENEHSL